MKTYIGKAVAVISIVALALVFVVGSAWADGGEPVNDSTDGSRMAQMVDWMGPENWGQMIQRMNQIHGPEWTAKMLQWMNQNDMPCDGSGSGHMMGHNFGGMFGWRSSRSGGFGPSGMMGR